MSDNVYKVVEIVGTSPSSVEDAVSGAIGRASQTLDHIGWFEIVTIRGHVENGRVAHYQVEMKVGFRLEERG